VLRVAVDPSWPPFEFIEPTTGNVVGFDVDLAVDLAGRIARQFAQPRPVRIEWVVTGFDGLYDVLLAGQADLVISALPFEPERVQDVGYSIAYFNAGLVLVVPESDKHTHSVQDLRGSVVAVEWGYVPEGDDRRPLQDADLSLIRYSDARAALEAVHTGAAEAALVDAVAARQYTSQCPGLRTSDVPVTDVNYVIASRLEDVRLRSEVDRALLALRSEDVLTLLIEKWF
jgi:ABC-type amino acid transport substrate-binding protein